MRKRFGMKKKEERNIEDEIVAVDETILANQNLADGIDSQEEILSRQKANSVNNKRIAKNTMLLYFRMMLTMGVSLYTSRVVLEALGVEDFGIYNVVGGIVILFSFINNALVTATQRFLNYELGKYNEGDVRKVFSASLVIHVLFALLLLIVAETIGLWFLKYNIVVPEHRWHATFWVYQFAILTACVNLLRAPYNAVIIAYEKMTFFAYISIAESITKLLIVWILVVVNFDRLINYSLLLFVVSILISGCYVFYAFLNFSACNFRIEQDKHVYKKLLSFSGWTLFGSLANVSATQGLNIILNLFFGVIVNAAMGIAFQVNVAIYNFVSNFQLAFTPQLVKSYAAGDIKYFINLIIKTSKYSYYLLFVIALPVYICCDDLLKVWLTDVPDYSLSFCRLMIIFSLLDAIQCPLWTSIQATGDIKRYQIIMSIMIFINIPLSWLALKIGYPPASVLLIRIFINAATFIVRLIYLNKQFLFPVYIYIRQVVVPCILISIVSYCLIDYLSIQFTSWSKIVIVTLSSVFLNMILIVSSLGKTERMTLINFVKNKICY